MEQWLALSSNTVQLRVHGLVVGCASFWMVKPVSDRLLSDQVSVGLLTRVFPVEVVNQMIADDGRTEQLYRSLTARVMAYFAIGVALHSKNFYEDMFAQSTDGLSRALGGAESWSPPSKLAIFQARSRLGFETMHDVFTRVLVPWAGPETPGSW